MPSESAPWALPKPISKRFIDEPSSRSTADDVSPVVEHDDGQRLEARGLSVRAGAGDDRAGGLEIHQDGPLGRPSCGRHVGGAGSARCSRWAARVPRRPARGRPRRRRRRRPAPSGCRTSSPAFCSSTTFAIRRSVSSTCSWLTTPWCSQLATCWAEMRQVARSSISGSPVMSGTLEQPTPDVDPADDVPQQALQVVVDLVLPVVVGPVGRVAERHLQQLLALAAATAGGELLLTGAHVDLVVVQRVQGRGGRRRHPGAARAGLRVADLGLHHRGEAVGRGPHALADLGAAQQAALEADVDVEVLVGRDPGLALHVVLADHRPGLHGGVDLVAGAVEEAGVDEGDPLAGLGDAGLEVQRRTPLLVHDPDLDGQPRQAEQLLDPAEQLDGEGDLVGTVHLRLHDVHRPGAGVRELASDR